MDDVTYMWYFEQFEQFFRVCANSYSGFNVFLVFDGTDKHFLTVFLCLFVIFLAIHLFINTHSFHSLYLDFVHFLSWELC